jgi:thymidylate synthase
MHQFTGDSADDLMRTSIEELLKSGTRITPNRGPALELHPVTLTLRSPRARLSRTEARGRLFSALGETCWYLSRGNDARFIAYYIEYYRQLGDKEDVWGGYGTRLFNSDGFDQVHYVIDKLRATPDSRQAVIQIFDCDDVASPHDDVPCTCVLQYLVRGGVLDSIVYMRSNDVRTGLPHDLFAFTMLQELIARSVGIDPGTHTHVVGSYHLYESDLAAARAFLDEGWQSNTQMPSMPTGDPWDDVSHLLDVERAIRSGDGDPMRVRFSGTPYWADLERLLAIFSLWKSHRLDEVELMRKDLHDPVYQIYISDKVAGK